MSEQIKVTCPSCKKELEIPADLEEFSCLYCGERSRVAAVLASKAADRGIYANLLPATLEELPKTVTRYGDYYKKITRKEFPDAFAVYEAQNADILRRMDDCAAACPEGIAACMQEVCAELLDAIEAHLKENKAWNRKSARERLFFETKVILAIFLTPLAQKLKLACAKDFRSELNRQWLARYPKENWTPGDYQTISDGFRKRKFCFITTAVCQFEGRPDDCTELTALRAFRDGWLSESEGGAELIEQYYALAPSIVACIDYCDDPVGRYAELRTRWLTPCLQAVSDGRSEDCRAIYTDMVRTLQARYLQA